VLCSQLRQPDSEENLTTLQQEVTALLSKDTELSQQIENLISQ